MIRKTMLLMEILFAKFLLLSYLFYQLKIFIIIKMFVRMALYIRN